MAEKTMHDRLELGSEITIIGAGIVGVCSALWLQREGFNVTMVDRGEPGSGTSSGNTAMISPGQVVPQSFPGLVKNVPRWLLSNKGPLKIRASYLPRIAPWLWTFSKAAKVENAIRVSRSLRDLHGRAFELYADLVRGTPAEDFFEKCGHLHLTVNGSKARSPELTSLMREAAGVEIEHLSQDDIRALEPQLAPIFKSGVLFPGNGRCRNPQRLVQTLANEAIRLGARFVKTEVQGIKLQDGQCESITLNGVDTPVRVIVVAAGIGSRALTERLGMRVPLETERGYHVTIANPGIRPGRQIIVRDWGAGLGPIDDNLRVAGTVEFCNVKAKPDWRRADKLLMCAKEIFPSLNTSQTTRWMGDRPTTSDGLPVLGRSSRFQNVYFAFGNAQHGMSAAPMMGKALTEVITGGKTTMDISPLSPDRF